jgi:hypothetical protein
MSREPRAGFLSAFMSNDYRIRKERVAVVLTLLGGERVEGDLFVQLSARNRLGPEDAPDVLNAPEAFFPFVTADGETYLVAKDRVREVEVDHELDKADEWRIGAPSTIEIALGGGVVHRGVVYLESVVTGRGRVLDYLNRLEDRFLTLHTPAGAILVNRLAIERVHPVD